MKKLIQKNKLSKKQPINRHTETVQFLKEKNLSTANWYLVIGPSNSGKTTLLKNSELKFSLEKKILDASNISATTDYDWWVTKQALFIDMPGHLFKSNDKTAAEHQENFLRFLRKNCHANTPTGIILVLNIEEMLNKNQKSKMALYNNIKHQLKTIFRRFKKPIPLLIILNKCDLITGFREFFGELSLDERRQIWGISFNQKESLLKQTHTKFNQLIQRLNRQLIWRLQHEYNIDKRALINDFTLQFKQIRQYLIDLVKNIQSKTEHKLYLRGLFLTAATQKAAVMNIFNASHSTNSALINTQQPIHQAYFIHDLFQHHLLTIAHEKFIPPYSQLRQTLSKYLVVSVAAAIIVIVTMFSILGFKQQVTKINKAESAISSFLAISGTNNQHKTPLKTQLKTLHVLKDAATAFSNKKWSLATAISPSHTTEILQKKTLRIYQRALGKLVLPQMTKLLNQALTDNDASNQTLYAALQTYLMLSQVNQYNPHVVDKNIQTIWNTYYPNQPDAQMLKYFHDLANNGTEPIAPDNNQIAKVRSRLLQAKPKTLAYIIFQSQLVNYPNLSLDLNNGEAAQIFTFVSDSIHLNGLYTSNGFKQAPNLMKEASMQALKGNAVLGPISRSSRVNPSLVNSWAKSIQAKYLNDYATVWLSFLNNIAIVNFPQIDQLTEALPLLIEKNSLLRQLSNLIKQEIPTKVLANSAPLNNIAAILTSNSPHQSLNEILVNLQKLNDELTSIVKNSNPDQNAFQLASYRIRNNGKNDAIESLLNITSQYPQPMKTWLNDVATNAWQVILLQAQNYINKQWKENVFKQYEAQLDNRFPFNENASSNASLESFTYFFAPNGLLDKFFSTYLAPFINTTQTPWTIKNIDGNGLAIANVTLRHLKDIYKIQHTYFKNNDPHLFVPFSIQPTSIEDSVGNLTIQLGKQLVNYANQTPFENSTFIWPDDDNSNLTQVIFTDAQSQQKTTLTSNGPWGLFKILKHSHLTKTKHPYTYTATLDQNGSAAMISLTTKQKENPFSLRLLNHFRLPREIS